jgi:sigma-B regulation protein RsbU (phosphoserine phosphatase)
LPQARLTTPWCEVAGRTVPATEVGGDYFDYLTLPGDLTAVVVADVSGHGVGAGLLSAMTKSAFRTLVTLDPAPVQLLGRLNETVSHLVERKMFVTMAYLLLDHGKRTARIATAGHPPVIRIREPDHAVEELRTPSLGLGMNRSAAFTEITISLTPGDRFVLYTDGVVETPSRTGEQFGLSRLEALAAGDPGVTPGEVVGRIFSSMRGFGGPDGRGDDATVVVVRVNHGQ